MGFHYALRYSQDDKDSAGGTSLAIESFGEDTGVPLHARGAFLDQNAYIVTNIDVLNDESDTVYVSDYLSKAVVYYVKAKIAEDKMQIEEKEYFMKEFRKIIEKQESARMGGHRKIMAGISAIR